MKNMKKVLATGLVVGTSFAMTVPAFAATNGQQAINRYKAILSKPTYSWSSNNNPVANKTKDYRFALYDANHDGVKELFLNNSNASHVDGWETALTFYKGKVKTLRPFDQVGVYKKSGIVYKNTIHMGCVETYYYRIRNGKWVKVAYSSTVPTKSYAKEAYGKALYKGKNNTYVKCQIKGKNVSYKSYKKGLNGLLKNSNKKAKLTYHKNTAANRNKYLK